MKKIRLLSAFFGLVLSIFCLSLLGTRFLESQEVFYAEIFAKTQKILEDRASNMVLGETVDIRSQDVRIKVLSDFLSQYNSPLEPYSAKLVSVSDRYGFDYSLLPAIAMVESGLCQKIPEGSHNCWGWGIYGKNVTRFVSYDEAIEVIAKGIKTQYLDKGFVSPEEIMTKYNPNNHNNWLGKVNTFMQKLE
jgi:hypothetical protein